ncbi:MAG: histidine kinase [Flavobacteriales bacterium]
MREAEREVKELRMRTRLAKDIHDDVGSGLARLAALSRSPQRSIDADARFEKVGAISSELLDNLRDVVWMNDPRNGTLDQLPIRLREFALDPLRGQRCQGRLRLPGTTAHNQSVAPSAGT